MAEQPNTATLTVTGDNAAETAPSVISEATASGEAKFTQADIDRVVKERLDREKAKAAKYADYDQIKAELTTLQQEKLTEEEKRQRKLAELETKQAEAEAKATAALSEANKRLARAAVLAAAVEAGFQAPEDAFSLIEPGSVTVDDDGKVLGEVEAVAALAQAKPYLLRRVTAPNLNSAPAGAPNNGLPKLTPEQERIAKQMGIPVEKYAQRLAERQATTRR